MTADLSASPEPGQAAGAPEGTAPAWFTSALSERPREYDLLIDAVPIHCRSWGDAGDREIVLVHGGAASSRWWDHIAPALADEGCVTAIDLSGHGESGRRSSYSIDEWAAEPVAAVARAPRVERILIGHSLGGFVSLRSAALFPTAFDRVIVIDSPVRDQDEKSAARLRARARPHRPSPTRKDAESRFAPRPLQPDSLPYILRHIAATSVVRTVAGWTWRFDPQVFDRPGLSPDDLAPLEIPVTILRAEHGMLTEQMAERMRDILGPSTTVTELPDTGHHAMLDRPLLLIEALRRAIQDEPSS
jgi:pimeloyl-ACP methyl ester carboxylesterase